MKVKDLAEILSKANQDADLTFTYYDTADGTEYTITDKASFVTVNVDDEVNIDISEAIAFGRLI